MQLTKEREKIHFFCSPSLFFKRIAVTHRDTRLSQIGEGQFLFRQSASPTFISAYVSSAGTRRENRKLVMPCSRPRRSFQDVNARKIDRPNKAIARIEDYGGEGYVYTDGTPSQSLSLGKAGNSDWKLEH